MFGSTYEIAYDLRLGSCSTTESRKSCGVMYSCPSNSADANFINRLSRDVNLTDFSESSCRRKTNKWNTFQRLTCPISVDFDLNDLCQWDGNKSLECCKQFLCCRTNVLLCYLVMRPCPTPREYISTHGA